MIEYVKGNIFDSPAQTIVNTVNTVGVMGKGLALSFKERYPEMFSAYRTMCEKHKLVVGKLMLYSAPDHLILLFPTKENWRNPSKIEYIESGLVKFVNTYAQHNITSVAFPKLGCGNGELNWDDVKPIMEKYLRPLPIDIYIYLGQDNTELPEHKNQKKMMDWLKSNAKDLSFNAVKEEIVLASSIIPIELFVKNEKYHVVYENGLIFKKQSDNHTISIDEDSFFCLWDNIRENAIFSDSEDEKQSLTYALLYQLGYLAPIMIKKNNTPDMIAGYQVREGLGRVFSLNWSKK